jgi:hypothetical protein
MGIKSYMTNLVNTFPNISTNIKPNKIDILSIDLNGILHKICNFSNNKEDFKINLFAKLKKLIKKIKPTEIAIFTDGQAILAKANTQIKRRNKYLYTKPKTISPLNLTPGTPFMDYIDDCVNEFISTLDKKTYYSSSKESNEGEIKLFTWLLETNTDKIVCVAGSDSDLIVIALASRPLLNLYIYDDVSYISLFKLVENLSSLTSVKSSYQEHPVRMDFVLLSLLQGNDYNNKLCTFEKLLGSYKKLQKENKVFLINKKGQLNLHSIKKLLIQINHSYDIIYTQSDVNEYLKSIQWNLNLYSNKIDNMFIPKYQNISIGSMIKFFPKSINLQINEPCWLKPEVYTLLLIPITGKNLLPEKLKVLLDDTSPIKDLFPEPCTECIQWKSTLKNIIPPNDDMTSQLYIEYKKLLSLTTVKYNTHIKESHKNQDLPIDRINEAVNNL